jgi:hypothetical protein
MDGLRFNRRLPPPPAAVDSSNSPRYHAKKPPALSLTTRLHRNPHDPSLPSPPMSDSPTLKEFFKLPEDRHQGILGTTSATPVTAASAASHPVPPPPAYARASISIPPGPTWAPQATQQQHQHQPLPSIQPRTYLDPQLPPPPYLERPRSQSIPQYQPIFTQPMYQSTQAVPHNMQFAYPPPPPPGFYPGYGPLMSGPQMLSTADVPRIPKGNTRRGKGHVAKACLNCKKAHLSCDNSRPCGRCINNNKQVFLKLNNASMSNAP